MKTKVTLIITLLFFGYSSLSLATDKKDEKNENYSAMTVNVSGKLKLCNSDDKGYAFIDVKGGKPPYRILSKNKVAGPIMDNLNPGSYTIIVEDNNGLKLKESFVVQPPMPVFAELIEIKNACSATDNKGSARLGIKFIEKSSVRIEWSHGLKNSLVAENLDPGNYTVQVFDESSCETTIHFEIKEVPNPEYTFTLPAKKTYISEVITENSSVKWMEKKFSKDELKAIADEIISKMDNK